ncbi:MULTISPECIES: hypothetical protein [Acidobacteriaceae]|uniref:hypothetical protein n=1 Tax=Acidobacteriaceae TaxID=204434 RepID=UPI00131AAD3E|nr:MULTISPECIES: hypothetical protein [Acidobacteriaceae]MDW5265637.1 hypothetical protein [Edaphobacter sp.]
MACQSLRRGGDEQATARAKYRGLSTALRFGRDDVVQAGTRKTPSEVHPNGTSSRPEAAHLPL